MGQRKVGAARPVPSEDRRASTRRRPSAYLASGVFLNVPFDSDYEPCFVALVAGVATLGLLPTSVLEVPASKQRLERIHSLLSACRYSVHDLSRVELSAGRYPRFNMPFEAGLASALALAGARHERFIFETRSHRVARTCSDLAGVDVKIHHATTRGMLRAVSNAFTRPGPGPTFAEMQAILRDVQREATRIKREHGTLFEASPFRELAAFGHPARSTGGCPGQCRGW